MNSRNSSRYNPSICLRPANPDDVALLKYWDTKPHVIAAGGDDDWFVWEEELSRKTGWQEFFIAEKTPARSEEFILSTRRVKNPLLGKSSAKPTRYRYLDWRRNRFGAGVWHTNDETYI